MEPVVLEVYDFERKGFDVKLHPSYLSGKFILKPQQEYAKQMIALNGQAKHYKGFIPMDDVAAKNLLETLGNHKRVYAVYHVVIDDLTSKSILTPRYRYLNYHLNSPKIMFFSDAGLEHKLAEITLK